jgi:hypothetical protein
MGLARTPDRFLSDRASADVSIRAQMDFVYTHRQYISAKSLKKTEELREKVNRKEYLEDWERSEIENIYEQVMAGMELPSVEKHYDKRRKGLRF